MALMGLSGRAEPLAGIDRLKALKPHQPAHPLGIHPVAAPAKVRRHPTHPIKRPARVVV